MPTKIMSRFPKYDWYCVHCHEKLNNQAEFNDNKFTWKCTNCSYKNSISKDNLRKPYHVYRKSLNGSYCLSRSSGQKAALVAAFQLEYSSIISNLYLGLSENLHRG